MADLVECGVSKYNIDILIERTTNDYKLFKIVQYHTPHNAPNCAYVLQMNGETLFYATDCNSLEHIKCPNAELYMVEANYRDAEIQERIAQKNALGQYPYELEVVNNHLSEEKALAWICENAGATSQYILMHRHEG